MESKAQELRENGVAVLDLGLCVKEMRDAIDYEMGRFPEFKPNTAVENMIGGGFCALGNPSSFHNPAVRSIRVVVHKKLVELFKAHEAHEETPRMLEQIIDRLMVRPTTRTVTPESWHRDLSPLPSQGDTTFGGWICLDDTPQVFTCCPKSHISDVGRGTGFAPIPKSEHASWKAKSVNIAIPPGHVIVFNENIVHCINATKRKETTYRLFLGWRLTHESTPLFSDTFDRIKCQAPMQLKSGQEARIFPLLHWTNWRSKLHTYNGAMLNRCLVKKEDRDGIVYKLPHEVKVKSRMKSLREYGLQLYPKYSEEELAMHLPSKLF